jgi:hypothetical protein
MMFCWRHADAAAASPCLFSLAFIIGATPISFAADAAAAADFAAAAADFRCRRFRCHYAIDYAIIRHY